MSLIHNCVRTFYSSVILDVNTQRTKQTHNIAAHYVINVHFLNLAHGYHVVQSNRLSLINAPLPLFSYFISCCYPEWATWLWSQTRWKSTSSKWWEQRMWRRCGSSTKERHSNGERITAVVWTHFNQCINGVLLFQSSDGGLAFVEDKC